YTSGDALTLFDGGEDTGLVLDPAQVRLHTVDGRIIDVDRGGITRIEDRNNNVVTITSAGIAHSSGRSVAFTRDAAGRIVGITDPRGKRLVYEYTGGDLTTYTDAGGNATTYTYDQRHNLLDIHDPLGNRAIENEY